VTQDGKREFLDAAQSGEPAVVEQLLARHLPRLRAFVRLRVPPALRARESASDVVQSVCKDLLLKGGPPEYRGEGAFRAWLFTAALRKIREHEKYHFREKRDLAREETRSVGDCYAAALSPSREMMAQEEVAEIEAAFDRLPDADREVITLARFAGLSHAEIAAHLGRSEVAVRSLLSRALARLAGLLVESDTDRG